MLHAHPGLFLRDAGTKAAESKQFVVIVQKGTSQHHPAAWMVSEDWWTCSHTSEGCLSVTFQSGDLQGHAGTCRAIGTADTCSAAQQLPGATETGSLLLLFMFWQFYFLQIPVWDKMYRLYKLGYFVVCDFLLHINLTCHQQYDPILPSVFSLTDSMCIYPSLECKLLLLRERWSASPPQPGGVEPALADWDSAPNILNQLSCWSGWSVSVESVHQMVCDVSIIYQSSVLPDHNENSQTKSSCCPADRCDRITTSPL